MRFFRKSDIEAWRTLDTGMLADELEARRRKRRYAYPAWLCLGSHYLYLGRPAMQALFWLTAGGLLVWWLVDFFRLPGLVDRQNRRTIDALLRGWRLPSEPRFEAPATTPFWTRPPTPSPAAPAATWDVLDQAGAEDEIDVPAPIAPHPRFRAGAGAILIALPLLVVAIGLLAPRPVYPRAAAEPSYRTIRDVNVRASASIGSPILAKLEKNVLIRGAVEEVEGRGPSRWLRITRGAHQGRYVALQNLDRR